MVLKSGNLDLLETSGPVQACNGIALTLNIVKSVLVEIVRVLSSKVKVKQSGTGLDWPRGFQEVKVPRSYDKGTGWW